MRFQTLQCELPRNPAFRLGFFHLDQPANATEPEASLLCVIRLKPSY